MGHIYCDILVKGKKRKMKLEKVLVNTGATYTVLPEDVIEKIGAFGPLNEIKVELGNSRRIKAKTYAISVKINGSESPAICITFKDAKPVIGIETLESLGMRLNPEKESFEFTRPSGVAYFYNIPKYFFRRQ